MDWMMASLSGSTTHTLAPWAVWHARCMVLSWGILLPLGVLVARFFKVLPGQNWPQVLDHKAWWHAHRALQWSGVGIMLVGMWLVWGHGGSAGRLAQFHTVAGWSVCAIGVFQIVGALARGSKGGPTETSMRGDHYDMTLWRLTFERLHKGLGWLAVMAAVAIIVSGLQLADAPRWMADVLALWWLALVMLFVRLQRADRCIDTYQAIWGPDPGHPGNQRKPIGLGIRRPMAKTTKKWQTS